MLNSIRVGGHVLVAAGSPMSIVYVPVPGLGSSKMKGPFLFDTLRQAKKKAKDILRKRFKAGEITREEEIKLLRK